MQSDSTNTKTKDFIKTRFVRN